MDIWSRENDAYGGAFTADGCILTFPMLNDPGAADQALGGLLSKAATAASLLVNGGPVNVGIVGTVGLLVQSLGLQYSQMITKIYELGTKNCYFIGGRSQGSLSMARIIGPRPLQVVFYRKFGDVCFAATNTIEINVRPGCPTNPNGQPVAISNLFSVFMARFCVIVSMGIAVNAQDVVINEQLQIMFGALNVAQALPPVLPQAKAKAKAGPVVLPLDDPAAIAARAQAMALAP